MLIKKSETIWHSTQWTIKIIMLKPCKPCKDLAFSPESLFYVSDFESDFKDPLQIRSLAFQKSSLFASMKALPKKFVIYFSESSSKKARYMLQWKLFQNSKKVCYLLQRKLFPISSLLASMKALRKKFVICFNESSSKKVRYLLQWKLFPISLLFASMKALPKKFVICFNESSFKKVICFDESSSKKVRYLLQWKLFQKGCLLQWKLFQKSSLFASMKALPKKYLLQWKLFKTDEKCFLLYLKCPLSQEVKANGQWNLLGK